jgi:hypothetical protein
MSLNTEPNRVLHAVAPRTPAVCIILSGTRFTRSGQCILRRRSAIVECRVTRKASSILTSRASLDLGTDEDP